MDANLIRSLLKDVAECVDDYEHHTNKCNGGEDGPCDCAAVRPKSYLEAALAELDAGAPAPPKCERCNLNPATLCAGCHAAAEDTGVTIWPAPNPKPHGPVSERFMRHHYGAKR